MADRNILFFYKDSCSIKHNAQVIQWNFEHDTTVVLDFYGAKMLQVHIFGESRMVCVCYTKYSAKKRWIIEYYDYPLSQNDNHPIRILKLDEKLKKGS